MRKLIYPLVLFCCTAWSSTYAQYDGYLQMNSTDAVHLIVSDPQGRSQGFDPRLADESTGGIINQIPEGSYTDMSLGYIPEEGEDPPYPDDEISREFVLGVNLPEGAGRYRIRFVGTRTDAFKVHGSFDAKYNNQWQTYDLSLEDVTDSEHVTEYVLDISQDGGAAKINKVHTAEGALQEVEIMRKLGWLSDAATDQLQAPLAYYADARAADDTLGMHVGLRRLATALDQVRDDLDDEALRLLSESLTAFEADLPPAHLPRWPGALTLATPGLLPSFAGNSFLLSGIDHTAAGDPADAAVPAVVASTDASLTALLDALGRNQTDNLVGIGDVPAAAQGPLGFRARSLADFLSLYVTDTLPSQLDQPLGSLDEPVVAVAPEGLRVAGNLQGTGVLLVEGALSLAGSAAWTGLVVVRDGAEEPASVTLRGQAGIVGGVLLVSEGEAILDIGGTPSIRFSRAVFDALEAALDL